MSKSKDKKEEVKESFLKVHGKKNFCSLNSAKKYRIMSLLLKLSILVSFVLIIVIFLLSFSLKSQCGDGSYEGSCSLSKPYYCNDRGQIIENASFCGCPDGRTKYGNSCLSTFHFGDQKDIDLRYIVKGEEKELRYTVYSEINDYVANLSRYVSHENGKIPEKKDFKSRKINEELQRDFLLPLVIKIQNLDKDKEEQLRIAVSIVQNIEWGYSDKVNGFSGRTLNYRKYPYEVLYDEKGVCGEKSELLVFLLKELGYDVAIFHYIDENHESVGVKCPLERSLGGTGYCFVETSAPSIISDNSLTYADGIALKSEPELIRLSEGLSLGKNLYEYRDAETNRKINDAIAKKGEINRFQYFIKERLRKKYNLANFYDLG